MEKDTYFSIIIPVYNTKKVYIKECIDSVFKQSYKNYEIVIVNDGSNKETTDYINTYKKINNITIINQANRGQYYSRVKGIESSKGDYILFLDSDDLFTINALETLNNIINKKHYDMITFSYKRFSNSTSNVLYSNDYFKNGELTKDEVITELLKLHISGVCLKCVKREIAIANKDVIDSSLREGEDLGQSALYVINSNSFYNITEAIYLYRYNEELKDYYDTKVDNIDFLMPVYNLMFKNNNKYRKFELVFKENAIKAIIYSSFKLCKKEKDKTTKYKLLSELDNYKIIGSIRNINKKTLLFYDFLFSLLLNKKYALLNLLANFYYLFR